MGVESRRGVKVLWSLSEVQSRRRLEVAVDKSFVQYSCCFTFCIKRKSDFQLICGQVNLNHNAIVVYLNSSQHTRDHIAIPRYTAPETKSLPKKSISYNRTHQERQNAG